jgi:tetratricopeptide (TPR) repeat protein
MRRFRGHPPVGPEPAIINSSTLGIGRIRRLAPPRSQPAVSRNPRCVRLPCLFALLALLLSGGARAFDDVSLALPAAQYLQSIRDSRDAGGQPTATLLQQADQQARQKNWTAAIAALRNRHRRRRRPDRDLAGPESGVASQDGGTGQGRRRAAKRAQERTRQAAWNAFQAARAPYERARALFRLGELYDRDKEPKKAIAAFREALELEDNPRIAKRYQELADANAFQIKGVEVESDSAAPKICLKFSDDLTKGRRIHYEDYLVVQPAIQPVVSAKEQSFAWKGSATAKATPSRRGPAFPPRPARKPEPVRISPPEWKIASRPWVFAARPTCCRSRWPTVALISVNLDAARLRVLRINDRNLLQQIENRRITNLLDGYDLNAIAKRSGEPVWEGTLTLASGERNQEITTAIPIGEILRDPQPGIYIVAAEPTKEDPDSYEDRATQWLVVSDIGLFTLRGNDGLHVFARSLATTKPLPSWNCGCTPATTANWARPSPTTRVTPGFDPGLLRGDGGREPAALMAFGNGDYNFLDLTKPAFDLSDRGVEGRAAPGRWIPSSIPSAVSTGPARRWS